ncbi:hypothetical protein LBMAG42_38140 [Deltaproteobacteria bacterium]|nr:hypothetical protein LBMAG42_38140 [Deltaproteobacteria bacterium]
MRRSLPILSLLVAACETTETEPEGFQGGDFEVTIENATDMCVGGSLESVFLPTGEATPFESPMELPGVIDIPWTHTVDFVDPFGEMQVIFEQGAQGSEWFQALNGEPPPAVEIDPINAPGCFVDATVDMYMNIVDSNALAGSAIVHLESFDEAECPVQTTDLCDVKLDLRWQRL